MTVGNLKKILKNVPDSVDIYIYDEDGDEFDLVPLEAAKVQKVKFSEEPGRKGPVAYEDVLILSDDILDNGNGL